MKKNLLLFILLFANYQVFTQAICLEFHHIGEVNAMEKNDNYFWLGTTENGLIRYNVLNETFQYFDTSNTILNSNHITAITWLVDTMYISTDNELYRYDNGNFALVNDTINGLLTNRNGKLVVVDVEMVYFLQNDQIVAQKDLNTIPSTRSDCCTENTEVTIDNSGNLWIARFAFYEYDVLKFDGTNWESFHSSNTAVLPVESFTFNGMTNIYDTVLVTNWNGIQLYDNGNWSSFYDFSTPFIDGTDTIFEALGAIQFRQTFTNQPTLWLGTDGRDNQRAGRLLYYENGWQMSPIIDSLPSIITKIHIGSPYVYVGTSTGLGIMNTSCFLIATNPIEQEKPNISIYPNPATDQIFIKNESNIDIQNIELYDINGRLCKQFKNAEMIDITNFSNGFYILKIKSEVGILSYKIWIQ